MKLTFRDILQLEMFKMLLETFFLVFYSYFFHHFFKCKDVQAGHNARWLEGQKNT